MLVGVIGIERLNEMSVRNLLNLARLPVQFCVMMRLTDKTEDTSLPQNLPTSAGNSMFSPLFAASC